MLPRSALLGMTTIAAMTLLIWGAAYTSLHIFRDEVASLQEPTPRPTPIQVSATSSTAADVSNTYSGARIIVVCSELDKTQKSQTSCP